LTRRGDVILIDFPFSDLASRKRRPAVVLADASRGDWVLAQITSNPHADADAIEITSTDFKAGGLNRVSYARPLKLFTAHRRVFIARLGELRPDAIGRILLAVRRGLQ